jgi:hypothetical protein
MNAWHAQRSSSVDTSADQLHLLTLCLELQLDLLLVAVGSAGGGPAHPADESVGPRWDGETLDLTGVEPGQPWPGTARPSPAQPAGQSRGSWVEARLAGIADAVDELLTNPEIRRHPAVLARLLEVQATCTASLGTFAPTPEAPVAAAPQASGVGGGVEPGHFLG